MKVPPPALATGARIKRKGFTLIEMMVVIMIAGILIGLTAPTMMGLAGSSQFTKAQTTVAGLLEQARQYASSQNTYVWVAFWEDESYRQNEKNVHFAAIASTDGQTGKMISGVSYWNDNQDIDPSSATIEGSTNRQYQIIRSVDYVSRIYLVEGTDARVANQTTLPTLTNGNVTTLTNAPSFKLKIPYSEDKQTFAKVLVFTPTGEAKTSEDFTTAVEFGIVRTDQKNNPDCTLFRVNGTTGAVQVGRK